MKIYHKKQDRIYIRFDYNKSYTDKLREFKGIWNRATQEWCVELTLNNAALLKDWLDKNGFVYSEESSQCPIEFVPIEQKVSFQEIKEMLDYIKFPLKLRDYQIEALEYFINRENCINGSDMGTGKTLISIAYAELLNLFPCIVICPSTVKNGWKKEWERVSRRKIHIIDSKDSEDVDWKADVTIINYDFLFKKNKDKISKEVKLRYSRSLSKKWSLVILDEVHLCKNENSLRSKAVRKIVKKADKILALSGTVVMNRPKEIVNILDMLGWLKRLFPDKWFFYLRYCDARKTRFGWDLNGANNTLELNKVLRHFCYFRKEKREILKELPEIVNITIDCEITNKTNYTKAEKDFISYIQSFDIERAERAERAESLVKLTFLKELSIKGKLSFIEQFIKEWQEADSSLKLIIFGIRTQPLQILHEKIRNSVLVTGELRTEDKMKKIEEFKKDKQILLANLSTLSTGVDGLQEVCSNMAFIQLPPRPSDIEQAVARIERMGQKNSINVYYLLSQETIDVESMQVLKEKTMITDAVNKGVDISVKKIEDSDTLLIKKLKDRDCSKND